MTSIRIAIYASIALHFLRKTCRKLSPDRPRKHHGESRGYPVQVGVGITYTNLHPGPDGRCKSSYEYFRLATCIDLDTASDLATTLNDMKPGYGPRFSIIDPDEEITGYELENLAMEKICLNRANIRKCPDPDRLAKMMQSAAISVILHNIYPHW